MSGRGGRARTWWRVVGSLLTVVVVGWVVLQVVALLARSEAPVDTAMAAEGLATLVVELDGGSLELRGTDDEEVVVTGTLVSGWRTNELERRRDGDELVLRTDCPDGPVDSFCSADLVVEVPRELAVRVRSNDTSVQLIGLAGDLDVATSNDAVLGDDLAGEHVRVRSSNDRVELVGLRSPRLDVQTSNDRVGLTFLRPPDDVRVRTSNDRVEVVVPDSQASYVVDTTTSNGSTSTEVRSDPTAARRIDVRTSNDDVVVRYPG
jgi:hypothetical protein